MGRAPCCEKMGMKKGPWTPLEDQILTNYIRLYGHSNWRALPKLAGLLRCGKSCRLRWINYLRPDIKRGNFTPHEEQTIINLHHLLGNRWSAIAAKLPGRTDNEIKNVWHTHLKKRLDNNNHNNNVIKDINTTEETICDNNNKNGEIVAERSPSPQEYSNNVTEISTVTTSGNSNDDNNFSILIDESFWSEVISVDNSIENSEKETENWEELLERNDKRYECEWKMNDNDMEFWFDLFTGSHRIDDISDMPNF